MTVPLSKLKPRFVVVVVVVEGDDAAPDAGRLHAVKTVIARHAVGRVTNQNGRTILICTVKNVFHFGDDLSAAEAVESFRVAHFIFRAKKIISEI